jgi:hypothetical protein
VPLIMPSAPSEEKNSRSLQSTPSFWLVLLMQNAA